MMNVRFVSLDLKDFPSPRRPDDRKRSQFKASWAKTLELLEYELMCQAASGIVIQVGVRPDQIRQDGWPYSNAGVSHPAVILSFRDGENRPLSFPCDRFDRYEDNLRGIALSLEALRAVDRFGVTKRGEQYSGFKQIEGPKPWTVDDAAEFIAIKAGTNAKAVIEDASCYRVGYRIAARDLHPDAGGNPHEWKLLGDAKALLDAHHGLGVAKR